MCGDPGVFSVTIGTSPPEESLLVMERCTYLDIDREDENWTCSLPLSQKTEIHKTLGCRHYSQICKLLKDNLSNDEFKVFNLLESGLTIGSIDNEKNTFDPNTGNVLVNIERDSSRSLPEGEPYQGTIHELWHNIDYLLGTENASTPKLYSFTYNNRLLLRTLRLDIEQQIEKEAINTNGDLGIARKNFYEKINQLIKNRNQKEGFGSTRRCFYFYDIISGINSVFKENDAAVLEIIERRTTLNERSSNYWNERTLSTEYFAAIGCIVATGNIFKPLEVMNRYLPKSYDVYKKMIKDALENLENRRGR